MAVVMIMYNQIEYSSNFAKTSGTAWHYKDNISENITENQSFKYKARIVGRNPAAVIQRMLRKQSH